MLLMPTRQRAACDLADWGEEPDKEKDRLLRVFCKVAEALVEELKQQGHWADYIDPPSGRPAHTPSPTVFSEPDALEYLLGWRSDSAAGCKIVFHPSWGAAVYPACFMTTAPLEALLASIRKVTGDDIAPPAPAAGQLAAAQAGHARPATGSGGQ